MGPAVKGKGAEPAPRCEEEIRERGMLGALALGF